MILFLVPVTKVPFGGYYFQTLADYFQNPFEKGSKEDLLAQEILYYGIELHVGPYENLEHAIEYLEQFETTVRKEARRVMDADRIMGANNVVIGPAYVYTKGFTIEEIQKLLGHMQKNNTRCILTLNLLPHNQPLDTVNPYCLNKLE